jgi:hypothetical protein
MPAFLRAVPGYLLPLVSCLLFAACASEPVQPEYAPDPVDMSGNWELDYGSSDNLQAQFNGLVRNLNRQPARGGNGERGAVAVSNASREAILGLAQMAELVTQTQLMEIEQDRVSIRIEREDTFTLSCDYAQGMIQRADYGVGAERCFWDGNQLVFEIRLPEGLDIVHRFSASRDGESLAVVTTLYSSQVSTPFSLRRIYRRFDPRRSPYQCTETLTRGRVCTTGSAGGSP